MTKEELIVRGNLETVQIKMVPTADKRTKKPTMELKFVLKKSEWIEIPNSIGKEIEIKITVLK